jgi:hypothetical protein
LANVTEGVGRLHHLLGISVYGEISLHHGVELLSQDNCEGGLVRREQSRNGDVEVACRLIWLHGEVEDAIVDAVLFIDMFHGGAIPPDRKSVTLRLRLGSATRTLRSEEVMEVSQLVASRLTNSFGAQLRA